MTLSEFKAWFEGFTENMDGPPTADQWKRIKKRVKEIDGEWTPRHVFIERYVRPYWSWWSDGIYCSASSGDPGGRLSSVSNQVAPLENDPGAWRAAGNAEYASAVDSAAGP